MSLSRIDHVVVLVMENRSFDHLLGYRFGAQRPAGAMKLDSPRFTPGPKHTYRHVARQLAVKNGVPTMSGFAQDYGSIDGVTHPEMALGFYDRDTVKTYDYFAHNYLVCDRWFCSVPGPTLPNRCFLLGGHSAGITENVHLGLHLLTHELPTIFDLLSQQGVSWRSYYHDAPFLWLYRQHLLKRDNIRKVDEFYSDAANGTLPSVSWIDPNFTLQSALHLPGDPILPEDPTLPDAANDDHPPADITRGQKLALNVYQALRSSPQWDKTLFILTYDEHGGFYDSVPPPLHPERAPDADKHFHRFGVRVPTFLISPWVQKGVRSSALPAAASTEFEHTSIIRTIVERFCPTADTKLLKQRFATAASLRGLLEDSATARDAAPSLAFTSPPQQLRSAVGGISRTPAELRLMEQPGDFHKLMAGLAALAAREKA
ncbi:MAG: alkaline phosphatase family protein [Polyangiaceae bacterium]